MSKGPIRIIEGEVDGEKSFVILIWDPVVLSPEGYAKLVMALGDLVRAEGGLGVERIKSSYHKKVIQDSAERIQASDQGAETSGIDGGLIGRGD